MKKKILIVDDDASIKTLAEYYLVKEGYEVALAEQGLEALNILESNHFDLVLTDMMMPVMGGLELIEKLRAKDPNISIIMFSAAGSGDSGGNRKKALELKANGFLNKPFTSTDLISIISKSLI